MKNRALSIAESRAEQEYYSILARVLDDANEDPLQRRAMIYELARFKLRRDLYKNFNDFGWSKVHAHLRALDSAIDRLEADSSEVAPALDFATPGEDPGDEPAEPTESTDLVVPSPQVPQPIYRQSPKRVLYNDYDAPIPDFLSVQSARVRRPTLSLPAVPMPNVPALGARTAKHFGATLLSTVQLIVAAVLGVTIYTAFVAHTGAPGFTAMPKPQEAGKEIVPVPQNSQHKTNLLAPARTADNPGVPTMPIPSEYGVYAINDGHLVDLELLPIRVPDPRVAISAPIATPARVHLSNNDPQFIVFRRDLVNSVPDRVMLRVVARVARALTFDAKGKPTINDVAEWWVIRSNSYPMRVAPVADNPEMIQIRPESPELTLPAGRYVLVLKNLAYDFEIDGAQTDAAHCLERTDALNAPVYSECRNL